MELTEEETKSCAQKYGLEEESRCGQDQMWAFPVRTPLGFCTSVGSYSHTSHDKHSQRTYLQKGIKYAVNFFIIFKIPLCINETQNHNPFLILGKF